MAHLDHATLKLPTSDDVRRWQEQLDQLKQEEAEMKARHSAEEAQIKARRSRLDKLIAAAAAFAEAEEALEIAEAVQGPL